MAIAFQCNQCSQPYDAPENLAGKRIKCKKCGNPLTVPGPQAFGFPAASGPVAPAPSGSGLGSLLDEALTQGPKIPVAPGPASAGPPIYQGLPTSGKFELPKRERSKGGSRWSLGNLNFGNVVIVFLVLGGVGLFIAYREFKLAGQAKSTPQRLSVADLIAKGPGDNIYIDLVDAHLLIDDAVIETNTKNEQNPQKWGKMWIPVMPRQAAMAGQNRLGQVKVILLTKKCHNMNDVRTYESKTEFRGMVVNSVQSLGDEEKKLLAEGLPGTDVASCYIFDEGHDPSSLLKTIALVGGIASLAIGLVLLCRPKKEE